MRKVLFLCLVFLMASGVVTEVRAIEILTSNPLSTVSQSGGNTILHKELYAAYNFPLRYSPTGTDILHGTQYPATSFATWTFDLTALGLDHSDYESDLTVSFAISLDDCNSNPESSYAGMISVNGSTVHHGAYGASHGSPCGYYQGWDYTDLVVGGTFDSNLISVDLVNETPYGWIAIDYIAVTLSTPVPEPSTALLLGLGLVGLAARRRPRHRAGPSAPNPWLQEALGPFWAFLMRFNKSTVATCLPVAPLTLRLEGGFCAEAGSGSWSGSDGERGAGGDAQCR